ncbi:ATP phosphoribosyltransferase regulatory subunit [Rubrobacter taiwanensis]|jgi:ATP phosphoribosyltransferase regulatory subunit|uniref:ATP phosphoribosyltransferase regulatory subunit n=1 Tax=Rubrobacter taiwanensis TaxID=185139 RepID=A0A4R1BR65_9ACTN|nr:ATP phosphoribosyltransferase regulatory subunit [Rubrobacter taiwanensis]TCJ20210.1 ATP phosphoribosyltransferase regulatory subunit [Rubrobacter taiwanensis]
MVHEARRKFTTTPGTRDILPPESTRLRAVQAKIRERFRLFGFREVVTPVLEYAEVIEEPRLRDAAFKLFDTDNQTLLLRPEMTTPIARLVSRRLRNLPPPYKLSYVLPAYRRAGVGRGQNAELYQAGVEVVGSADPQADAEVISLLVDVLQSAGLEDFAVALGQRRFYGGYLKRAAPEAEARVLQALADKDLVEVDALSRSLPDAAAAGVREIPRLVGPASDAAILEAAARYAVGEAEPALENLRRVLEHLEAHGCLERIILDFGLIGRLGYYTGTVFEAYAAGLGFTLAGGGRYDDLLSRFELPLPATGFAISLERLLSVLPERGREPLLVLAGGGLRGTALAGELRGRGVPVLHLAEELAPDRAAEYARSVDAGWIAYPAGDELKLTRTGGEFEVVDVETAARQVLTG